MYAGMYCVCVHLYVPLQSVNNVSYFMMPPNIKAPKFFFQTVFYFPGSKVTRAHRSLCEHRWRQLTSESPIRIVESGRS